MELTRISGTWRDGGRNEQRNCDSERPEENAKTRRGENAKEYGTGRPFCRAPFPFHFASSLGGFPLAGYFAFSPAFAGPFRIAGSKGRDREEIQASRRNAPVMLAGRPPTSRPGP